MSRANGLAVGALVVSVVLGAACGRSRDEPRVELRDVVENVLYLTGEVRAARSIDLSAPQVPGYQPRIHYLAEDGAEVKAGAVVVGFDVGTWVSQFDDKRLALAQAEAALLSLEQSAPPERAQHQAALERALVERRKAEIDAEVPVDVQSRQEWQQKQNAARRAEAEYEKARLQLETFERTRGAELAKARIEVEKAERGLALVRGGIQGTELRAPEDGLVIVRQHWDRREDRPFQVGDTVWVGLVVVSLPALASLEVAAVLPEVDLGLVSAGQPVRCVADAFPDRALSGTVRVVGEAAVADGGRSGYPVFVELEARPDWLRPGMSVRAEVVRETWERALAVPRGAVVQEADASYVRLPEGGRAPVEVLACLATECVLGGGIEAGARVALP